MFYTYAYCYPYDSSDLLKDYECDLLPFYVGYGTGDRHLSHLSKYHTPKEIKSNPIKCSKIRKLIEAGSLPSIHILKRFQSKTDAIAHEISLIASIGTIAVVKDVDKRGPLSNLHKGGHGGAILKTLQGRKSISQKLTGRSLTPEWKRKISQSKTGNTHHSEETRKLISEQTSKALLSNRDALRKISETHLGKPKSEAHRKKLEKHLRIIAKDPIMKAKTLQTKITNGTLLHTEDTKVKISENTKAAMSDPKVINKMKKSSKKRWANSEERQKIADKNSKTFKLTHRETNETVVIKNLAQYCRDNNTHHRKVHLEFIVEKVSF